MHPFVLFLNSAFAIVVLALLLKVHAESAHFNPSTRLGPNGIYTAGNFDLET
jgi:hypothetical protein